MRQRRRETVLNPPAGIRYITEASVDAMSPDYEISKGSGRDGWLKSVAKSSFSFLELPNLRYLSPKILKNVDVVHTPGYLLVNHKPYVVEVDNPACLARYDMEIFLKRKKLITRFLSSRYCKKIICISEAAKKSMAVYFPKSVVDKCQVVYPYVKINPVKKTENLDKLVLLCVNTKFYMKATGAVLEAFEVLNKNHQNLELWVVSNTPDEYIQKYQSVNNIKFFPAKFNKQELYEKFYSQCDIFIQPSLQDSFGLVYLEVAASGKPIVTTDLYAIPEIVQDGKNGFLIKSPLYMYNSDYSLKPEYFPIRSKDTEKDFYKNVNTTAMVPELVEKLGRLISDQSLRQRMGQASLDIIQNNFSEKQRQEQLLAIYQAAL